MQRDALSLAAHENEIDLFSGGIFAGLQQSEGEDAVSPIIRTKKTPTSVFHRNEMAARASYWRGKYEEEAEALAQGGKRWVAKSSKCVTPTPNVGHACSIKLNSSVFIYYTLNSQ